MLRGPWPCLKIFLPGASSPCGPGVPSSQGNRETLCRWTELHQGISWFDFLKREEYYGTIAAKLSKTFCWWFVSDHKEYVFFDSSWGSLQRSARVLSERRVRNLEFMWFMLMFQCDSSWSRGDIFLSVWKLFCQFGDLWQDGQDSLGRHQR